MRVGVLGGSGFAAGELIRLLLDHPFAKLEAAASKAYAGLPVHRAHPNLEGRAKLVFSEELDCSALDFVFLAAANGEAARRVPQLLKSAPRLKIVDLSGDFRLKDPALYPVWYANAHPAPELLSEFVYGLPELNGCKIASAKLTANPGCFATAIALALTPLARLGARGTAHVSAVTGSSGSGALPGPKTHHPTREGSLHAYKPLAHQHMPEIDQCLAEAAGGRSALTASIVPVSGPLVRGIYAVCHVDLPGGKSAQDVARAYREAYAEAPFIRLQDEPPHLNAATGSNFCDLHWTVREGRIAAIASLDNLIKGAAGQAVQNMNLMMGWEETAGLLAAAIYPG